MNDFEADALKAIPSYFAKPLAVLVLLIAVASFGYCRGKSVAAMTTAYKAQVDTVRLTAEAKHEKAETVTVRLKAQARVDTLVKVLTDTTLLVNHDTVAAKPLITERIVTDDRTILALRSYVTADSASDRALAKLYAMPKSQRRINLSVGVGYGPQIEHDGAVRLGWNAHFGLSYRIF